jgi:hypothetical protein
VPLMIWPDFPKRMKVETERRLSAPIASVACSRVSSSGMTARRLKALWLSCFRVRPAALMLRTFATPQGKQHLRAKGLRRYGAGRGVGSSFADFPQACTKSVLVCQDGTLT